MLDLFKESLNSLSVNHQFRVDSGQKVLLAVSGGIDSVVMTHLFSRAGILCDVAHCNFSLRSTESDLDQSFVEKLARHYGFGFHEKRFDTLLYASTHQISKQMAARALRYRWFDELISNHGYAAVAVAHHADDVAETMLINLTRGTGLAGVHGIAPVHGSVIRPLLFASRTDIESYARQESLAWREDASNSEELYTRNRIRHSVIPQLKEINPAFTDAMMRHAVLMRGYENLIDSLLKNIMPSLTRISFGGSVIKIDFQKLMEQPSPEIILFHLLSRYGFSGTDCNSIMESGRTGALFISEQYRLIIGRGELVLIHHDLHSTDEVVEIHENNSDTDLPFGTLTMERMDTGFLSGQPLPADFTESHTAYIDSAKLTFPLTARPWKRGDAFHPLGMRGRKLLSDFFADEKFSPEQKETVYLLCSGNEVVWVIGHRIDDRFKSGTHSSTIRKFIWKSRY